MSDHCMCHLGSVQEGQIEAFLTIYSNNRGDFIAVVYEIPLHSDGLFPIAFTLIGQRDTKQPN